jgi:hypothetical protein
MLLRAMKALTCEQASPKAAIGKRYAFEFGSGYENAPVGSTMKSEREQGIYS